MRILVCCMLLIGSGKTCTSAVEHSRRVNPRPYEDDGSWSAQRLMPTGTYR
ncbi:MULTISPECIES: hypothetical protein [Sphingobacterium]|uniref:hypothetical protein n=1 Tax=Sphingobacterium TaxID=28453 RepID=UPI0013159B13|nr:MULTISPECIES: hypothetical protein [Sphingobacterium]